MQIIHPCNRTKRKVITIWALICIACLSVVSIGAVLIGTFTIHAIGTNPFTMSPNQMLDFGVIYPNFNYTMYYNTSQVSPAEQYLNVSTISFTNPKNVVFDLWINNIPISANNGFTTRVVVPANTSYQVPVKIFMHSDSPFGEFSINMNSTTTA